MTSSGGIHSIRRNRKSWSLSESDVSATLTTVDEEEYPQFLFDDDDLKIKSRGGDRSFIHKTVTDSKMRIQDLEAMNDSSDFTSDYKNTSRKPDLYHRRLHFYSDQFRSQSPSEIASSAESEHSVSMSIEGLRDHLQSCFTCGVVWRENQVSLDCNECDGYPLQRPCPDCDGNCEAIWTRDFTTSHQTRKAKWVGKCDLSPDESSDDGSCYNSRQ